MEGSSRGSRCRFAINGRAHAQPGSCIPSIDHRAGGHPTSYMDGQDHFLWHLPGDWSTMPWATRRVPSLGSFSSSMFLVSRQFSFLFPKSGDKILAMFEEKQDLTISPTKPYLETLFPQEPMTAILALNRSLPWRSTPGPPLPSADARFPLRVCDIHPFHAVYQAVSPQPYQT